MPKKSQWSQDSRSHRSTICQLRGKQNKASEECDVYKSYILLVPKIRKNDSHESTSKENGGKKKGKKEMFKTEVDDTGGASRQR